MKKLSYLRRLPMGELIWQEIGELMQIQRAVQLGGPEVRIKAVDYLKGRRRYMMHYEAGKITPGERLEETEMPDWGYVNDEDYKRAQTDDEDRSSLSEPRDETEGGEPEDDMVWVTVEDPIDCPEGAASSTWRPSVFSKAKARPSPSGGSGKDGGKGRNSVPKEERDPRCEDEYNCAA